jgi:hypothetical protein
LAILRKMHIFAERGPAIALMFGVLTPLRSVALFLIQVFMLKRSGAIFSSAVSPNLHRP